MIKADIYKTKDRTLTSEEVEKINSFYLFISNRPRSARIIYRGENYQNLQKKLNLVGDNDYTKLSYFIFLIGEKGRVYRQEYKNRITKKNKIYSINDISPDFFYYIFAKLNKVLEKHERVDVIDFKKKNSDLFDYFSNNKNKDKFVNDIKRITSDDIQLKIRDYYLNLLHTLGKIGFYYNSFFVSTTTDLSIAKYFSKNKSNLGRIVFLSWIPFPLFHIGLTFNYLNGAKELIRSFNLPIYSKSFFPGQNEISVKGGLLPQFILGFLKLKENEFVVNPHFLNTNKTFHNIMKYGIDIDQNLFENEIRKTDYSNFFTLNTEGEYYERCSANLLDI